METSTMTYEWFTAAGRSLSKYRPSRVETAAGYHLFVCYVNGINAYDGVVVSRDFYSHAD